MGSCGWSTRPHVRLQLLLALHAAMYGHHYLSLACLYERGGQF